ncbi:MAG: hypothetical protein AAB618_01380 [Patescibacteria group bacterium]
MNTSLITTKRLPGDIEEILGLKEMSVEEQEDFLLSVGTLIIESAVTKFIVSILPDERLAFELWLETHNEDDNLFERALEAYPLFAEILREETAAFQGETKRLLGVTN